MYVCTHTCTPQLNSTQLNSLLNLDLAAGQQLLGVEVVGEEDAAGLVHGRDLSALCRVAPAPAAELQMPVLLLELILDLGGDVTGPCTCRGASP